MNRLTNQSLLKITQLFTCMILLTGGIIVRLIYLQLYLMHDYKQRAEKNFTRIEPINSVRGNIVDRFGNLLATNRPVTSIFWQGTGNKQLSEQQLDYLRQLSALIGSDFLNPDIIHKVKEAERFYRTLSLLEEATFGQLSKVVEQWPSNPNIVIRTRLKRFYPHQTIACHVVGYISNTVDLQATGQMGLEKLFEPILRGNAGQRLKMINSIGANLYQEELQKALSGQDIRTTLDLSLQRIAEAAFPEEFSGCLILMEPHTGALRALLSRPSFDPDIFLASIKQEEWQSLQSQRPFINRALNACYPPASLFKLVTLSAAFETQLINEETTTYCRGFSPFHGRKYHCNNKLGHGALTITQAVALSCNPIFYEIGKRISIDTLAHYAQKFGLGAKTGILLPESAGTVPSTEWKLKNKKERWWKGETLSAVIGQSYLNVTPIQMACMISSIFQGYRVKPRILETEPITIEPLTIQKKTREFLKTAMEAVIHEGNAKALSKIKNVQLFAKTGTAQVLSFEKKADSDSAAFDEHAWIALHMQYADQQPLMLIILLEHAKSSKVAIRIAKSVILAYKNYVDGKKLGDVSLMA